jgi:hypothetical protein
MSRRLETPYYHRVDELLFLAPRPITEDEFIEAVRTALAPLGVVPYSVECMADGYQEPDLGAPRNVE